MMQQTAKFDVAIVGGGIVGLSLALALAKNNFNIVLYDSGTLDFSFQEENYDLRVSSITPASQKIFENLGVWDAIIKMRISPYRYIHVWDATGKGKIDFDATKIFQANLGFIIENNVMRKALVEELKKYNHVKLNSYDKLTKVNINEHEVEIISEKHHYCAKLIVGADGARSWLRNHFNIPISTYDYNHHALVTRVKTEKPHLQTAWQRFDSNSILAFLPLQESHQCSIVWSQLPEQAQQMLTIAEDKFNQKLSRYFANKLGSVEVIDKRVTFPLVMQHAKNYVGDRLALIGDAIHHIHPLAGMGVNLGILDAACLAEVLIDARKKERDFASFASLRRYERWRKSHNLMMINAMKGFKNLFNNDLTPIVALRNWGLNITNKASLFKNFYMKVATGLQGDLPKLAKKSEEYYAE